jgi:opacity protein-like surface antigen
MKKLLCVALLLPAVSFAAGHKQSYSSGLYARVDLGVGMRTSEKYVNTKTKSEFVAPVASVGAGYQFSEYFRSDINLQYRNTPTKLKAAYNGVSKIQNKSYAVMVNGSVDMPTGTMFTPYATAGVGFNKLTKSDYKNSAYKDKSQLAWNAGLGLKTKIQDNMDLDLGYKFVNLGEIKAAKKASVQAQEITAGLIVSF